MGYKKSTIIVDPIAGTVNRVFGTGVVKKNIGTVNKYGYLRIGINGKEMRLNRLIYSHFHGPIPPWLFIDHINGDKQDNRIENLRAVDNSGNLQNQRSAHANNTSGLLGVQWSKKKQKWHAQIRVNGKTIHLGSFDCKHKAHEAYVEAKRRMHSTCTI